MARIPYLPADIEEPQDTVAAMKKRRGGALARVDRLLLYSPPLAHAWTVYADTIRTRLAVPAHLRELATIVVSALMGNEHEVAVHGPHFLAAGGTPRQLEALREVDAVILDAALFDEKERAVLELAQEMTRSITVADETFAAAHAALGDPRLVIEIVAVIATYNMTNRFLAAMDFERG